LYGKVKKKKQPEMISFFTCFELWARFVKNKKLQKRVCNNYKVSKKRCNCTEANSESEKTKKIKSFVTHAIRIHFIIVTKSVDVVATVEKT